MTTRPGPHPSAEALQGLLERSLAEGERTRVQGHVDECARCRSELEGWSVLFEQLGSLGEVAPSRDFSERVMAALPEGTHTGSVPALSRVVGWLRGLVPGGSRQGTSLLEHVPDGRIQDFLDGALPRAEAERVEGHLHGCRLCREEADAWRSVLVRLDDVPRLAPSDAFTERVMAHVRIHTAAAVARPTLRERFAAFFELNPKMRQRLAALGGVSIAVSSVLALIAYTAFSQPLVTLGNVAIFLRLKVEGALAATRGWFGETVDGGVAATVVDAASRIAASPLTTALGVSTFLVLTLLAVWILYQNLFPSRQRDGSYAL